MTRHPTVLQVATGFINPEEHPGANIIDYKVYTNIPQWLRRLEELARIDMYLALRAKQIASKYDIVLAQSEKVGIPLSFMGLRKPLVVVTHHMESPVKARFARATGIVKRWAAIGYVSDESKRFLVSYFGIPDDRLFEWVAAQHLNKCASMEMALHGPIISVGVAKRDYTTLVTALSELAGYQTELYVSSKFGDKLMGHIGIKIPEWVQCRGYVPDDELSQAYQRARFAVVCLNNTTQNSAGVSAVFEAGAYGKAVIATKTGGMASFVRDGETGILIPPCDVKAMRKAIQQLWTQPDLAHKMGLAGRRYVEANFAPSIINMRISKLLDQIYAESL